MQGGGPGCSRRGYRPWRSFARAPDIKRLPRQHLEAQTYETICSITTSPGQRRARARAPTIHACAPVLPRPQEGDGIDQRCEAVRGFEAPHHLPGRRLPGAILGAAARPRGLPGASPGVAQEHRSQAERRLLGRGQARATDSGGGVGHSAFVPEPKIHEGHSWEGGVPPDRQVEDQGVQRQLDFWQVAGHSALGGGGEPTRGRGADMERDEAGAALHPPAIPEHFAPRAHYLTRATTLHTHHVLVETRKRRPGTAPAASDSAPRPDGRRPPGSTA